MMMSLGLFVFSIPTAAYQQLQRSSAAEWSENKRIGRRAASQFLGPGADTISLNGTLYPEFTGGPVNLERLRTMMNGGKAYTLMDGTGNMMGYWTIRNVNQTASVFLREGVARKIEFNLSLHHEPDDTVDLADLDANDLRLAGTP